mmetsp:Transcript_21896/g.45196  ORF Transcript_21896/g.45196 Transcript_21896/m.45196 type:complete len:106 (-) Transcript_21896:120-437(-)
MTHAATQWQTAETEVCIRTRYSNEHCTSCPRKHPQAEDIEIYWTCSTLVLVLYLVPSAAVIIASVTKTKKSRPQWYHACPRCIEDLELPFQGQVYCHDAVMSGCS